ncbi:unnamed protein product [Trichobilharzia szidati]|nr:unnamed protein product [Trichobilharzia szidati]
MTEPKDPSAVSHSHNVEGVSCDVGDIFQRMVLSGRFCSWAEFDQAFEQFMKASHTSYCVTSSRVLDKSGPMRYQFVQYHCTFGGKRPPRGAGLREKVSRTLGCESRIRVRYKTGVYRIISSQTVHNHPCTEEFLSTEICRRKLSADEMDTDESLLEKETDEHKVIELAHQRLGEVVSYNGSTNIQVKNDKHIPGDSKPLSCQYILFEKKPRSPSSVRQPSNTFRNVYERLRTRFVRLHKRNSGAAMREMRHTIRRLDILLERVRQRTLRSPPASVNRNSL